MRNVARPARRQMRSIKWHGRDDLRPTRSHAMHCFAVDDDPGDQISQTWSRGCFRKLARIFIHALARDLKTKVIQLAVVCKMYDFFFFLNFEFKRRKF